jgi:hypothetical protein
VRELDHDELYLDSGKGGRGEHNDGNGSRALTLAREVKLVGQGGEAGHGGVMRTGNREVEAWVACLAGGGWLWQWRWWHHPLRCLHEGERETRESECE